MKIDILTVGKLKEQYLKDAADEYLKRLSRYANVSVVEVKDEKTTESAGSKENDIVRAREAARLDKYINDSALLIPLCIEGVQVSSEEFAGMIGDYENTGRNHIQFVIGGSLGIDEAIKARGEVKLSFSKMTFPHQLMRIILLEQIYRAYRIKHNEPYHK